MLVLKAIGTEGYSAVLEFLHALVLPSISKLVLDADEYDDSVYLTDHLISWRFLPQIRYLSTFGFQFPDLFRLVASRRLENLVELKIQGTGDERITQAIFSLAKIPGYLPRLRKFTIWLIFSNTNVQLL